VWCKILGTVPKALYVTDRFKFSISLGNVQPCCI